MVSPGVSGNLLLFTTRFKYGNADQGNQITEVETNQFPGPSAGYCGSKQDITWTGYAVFSQ